MDCRGYKNKECPKDCIQVFKKRFSYCRKPFNSGVFNYLRENINGFDNMNHSDLVELKTIINILKNTNNKGEGSKYITHLWHLLVYQNSLHSPGFTSHGLDHSIRTTKYMLDLFYGSDLYNKNWKITSESTPNTIFYRELTDKYNCSINKLINGVIWTGILHDIGYSELELCQLNNTLPISYEKRKEWFDNLKDVLCKGKLKKHKNCENINCFKNSQGRLNTLGIGIKDNRTTRLDTSKSFNKAKFIHATLGKKMAEVNIGNLLPNVMKNDIVNAIGTHNFDSFPKIIIKDNYQDEKYRGKSIHILGLKESIQNLKKHKKYLVEIEGSNKKLEIYGEYLDKKYPIYDPEKNGRLFSLTKKPIVRDYVSAPINLRPLLSLLRIADNLDITTLRLSPEQSSIFLLSYTKIYKNSIENANIYWEKNISHIGNLNIDELDKIKSLTHPKSFDYFYMCWIIRDIKVYFNELNLDIKVFIRDLSKLSNIEYKLLCLENNWNEGILNFTRMEEAFKSISYNGNSLNVNLHFINLPEIGDKIINLSDICNIKSWNEFVNFNINPKGGSYYKKYKKYKTKYLKLNIDL